jgi:hypothetical protein
MGIGQFFKKVSSGTKSFFKKGGMADVGFRKFGNTLNTVGDIAMSAAPVAALVAPELAAPILAAGALSKIGGAATLAGRKAVIKAKGNADKIVSGISPIVRNAIEASKPQVGIIQSSPSFA